MPIILDHQLREYIPHNSIEFPITYFHDELLTLPDWAGPLHWHPDFEIATAECGVLDYQVGNEAGIKSASILISGENAFGYLKGESGVHRLVRISPFDSNKSRHTSFASVEATPEIVDDNEVVINENDLKIDTYRASGAGGQHVNRTDSAVRITHIPSGIIVACQTQRSQFQNKEKCMQILKSKLAAKLYQEKMDKLNAIKGVQKNIEWGSQIRSYVMCPYTLVKDNRTNHETSNVNSVLNGDLDDFIFAYLKTNINE